MSRTKSMKSQKNNLRQGFHHFNEDGPLDAWDTLQQNFESNQNEFNLWVAYLNSISFLYTVANFWGYKLKWDIKFRKHRWFSGRIIAFQAVDPGSIPGRCIFDCSTPAPGVLWLNACKNKRWIYYGGFGISLSEISRKDDFLINGENRKIKY